MTFNDIFIDYYTQYRAEADVPGLEDDEYVIAIPLANAAIRRWLGYQNTLWEELFSTAQASGDGTLTLAANTTTYSTPANMQQPGGIIRVFNTQQQLTGTIPVIAAHRPQFYSSYANFAYYTGDPNHGFVLNLNQAPTDQFVGATIDYMYYKQPTLIEDGDSVPEMSDPEFMVHHMLANRFRASRNPYYDSAVQDAKNALESMRMRNMSGTWANPIKLPDNSGSSWGR